MITTLTIASCLQRVTDLAGVSDSPRLDLELLLAQVLNKNRTYLITWPEKTLTDLQAQDFQTLLARRLTGEPIAHILGQREFWSLPLLVNNSTLIPRPDTELLVEATLALFAADAPDYGRQLLDLGTGTGAIVLALASEKKAWQCLGVDRAAAAIALAEKNRAHLVEHTKATSGSFSHVSFLESDWFAALAAQQFDVIVSNPPYIDPEDPHLQQGDVRFEPHSALVAGNHGLADIEHIITHAWDYLITKGWLLLEHGYQQGAAVRELLLARGYGEINTLCDFGGHERVSLAQKR